MNRADYCTLRELTEQLAQPLSPEDQTVQSMPDASPTKWHRAHVTWFFETFVLPRSARRHEPFDDRYSYLFNSYYDTIGARQPRAERGMLTRPSAAAIGVYRRYVDAAMQALLATDPPGDVLLLIELGLHHEQQHQELLIMDAKHALSRNPLRPAYGQLPWRRADAGAAGWAYHKGGRTPLGHDGCGFAFDNEGPRHDVLLWSFEIATGLVTCREWLDFMEDGGYQRPELWMSDGWPPSPPTAGRPPSTGKPQTTAGKRSPSAGQARLISPHRSTTSAGMRRTPTPGGPAPGLPTEGEWEAAAPQPGADDGGWYGAVWQWTASAYNPYPGFRPAEGAIGEYNGKFMVNQQTLRGSSWATPPGHARRTYRNFFPTGSRWCVGGVRLARDAS